MHGVTAVPLPGSIPVTFHKVALRALNISQLPINPPCVVPFILTPTCVVPLQLNEREADVADPDTVIPPEIKVVPASVLTFIFPEVNEVPMLTS